MVGKVVLTQAVHLPCCVAEVGNQMSLVSAARQMVGWKEGVYYGVEYRVCYVHIYPQHRMVVSSAWSPAYYILVM